MLYNKEIWSKSLKFFVFRLQTVTRLYEGGITSNRKSACYGETVLRSCTHRPSHAGSEFCLKRYYILFYLLNISNRFYIKIN